MSDFLKRFPRAVLEGSVSNQLYNQLRSEADCRIREQRELLDECERVIEAYLVDGPFWKPEARATLTKLRAQEKADEPHL